MEPHNARVAQALDRALSQSGSQVAVVEAIEGAVVAPLTKLTLGSSPSFDGGVYYSDGQICPRGLHQKQGFVNLPNTGVVPELEFSGTHLFAGILKNEHFGHFLAESLSRLWPLSMINTSIKNVVFYLRIPELPAFPRWAKEFFEILGLDLNFHIVSIPTKFETLLVPDQICLAPTYFVYGHPAIKRLVQPLRIYKSDLPEKIYVSRSRLTFNEGGVIGERVLERNFSNAGYFILHPQENSISDQLAFYSSAKRIVFAEGSALHLFSLVSRIEQEVFIVRRREMSMVFDWQIRTFGPVVRGTPCIQRLLIPKADGASRMRAKAILDFDALRDQLRQKGFINTSEWVSPSNANIAEEVKAIEIALRSDLVDHGPIM